MSRLRRFRRDARCAQRVRLHTTYVRSARESNRARNRAGGASACSSVDALAVSERREAESASQRSIAFA